MALNTETSAALAAAINSDDDTTLNSLILSRGLDVNSHYGEKNTTGLIYAAEIGNVQAIHCLRKHGARLNAKDNAGNTALINVAMAGKTECVEVLIGLGADVNVRNNIGETALFHACARGNVEMSELLVAAKANLNCETRSWLTPLIKAVQADSIQCVRCLVEAGAELTRDDAFKETALSLACQSESSNLSLIQYLLSSESRAKILLETDGRPLVDASRKGNRPLIEMLLDAGADINKFARRESPLISSCLRGHTDIIMYLLDRGADVNLTETYSGFTALTSAALHNSVEAVKTLLQCGCEIDHQDIRGRTALMNAAFQNNVDVVEILVEAGASITHVSNDKENVLTVAASNKANNVLRFLVESVPSKERGIWSQGTEKGLQLLNHQNINGETALMLAATLLNDDCVDILLKAGADPLLRNVRDQTALEIALHIWTSGSDKHIHSVVDKLLQYNGDSSRAFHAAIFNHQYPVVEALIEQGFLPSLEQNKISTFGSLSPPLRKVNSTPFVWSLCMDDTKLAKYFLKICYLHSYDVHLLRHREEFRCLLQESMYGSDDSLKFLEEVWSQPWTLKRLSFMTVSLALGFNKSRKERVVATGLPPVFQRKLLFQDRKGV